MDGCVAVVVAEAEAVVVAVGEAEAVAVAEALAVAVAVAAGDISPDETHLRRLNMRNKSFKKGSQKRAHTNVFDTF